MIEIGEAEKCQLAENHNVLCFNPACPNPKSRFFIASDEHLKNSECKRWIHRIDDLLCYDKFLLSNMKNENKGLLFDFQKEPIEALKKLASLSKLNWKHTVSLIFDEVGQQIAKQLDMSQKLMMQQIQKAMNSSNTYDTIIKVLANGVNGESTSKDLNEILNKSKIPSKSILMFDPRIVDSLVVQIKQIFSKTNEALNNMEVTSDIQQSLMSNSASQKTNIQEQMKKFEMWIGQQIDNQFSKVQILAATFSVVPNTFTSDAKNVGLECFLCRQNITSKTDNNKKNAKKVVTKLLLQHLMNVHQKEVFLNYRKKISKSLIRQYSMDQIIQQIKVQNIKKIQIIDRQNSGTYVAQENGQFIFEVVSQRNISLVRGNFVVAKSIAKDAADIVMSFLIKELFNIKNMTVRLVTNDHFGTTIEEICQYLGYDFKVISRIKK